MKQKVLLVLLMLGLLVLTGCGMKMETGLVVGKDGSVTMHVISAMDNDLIDYSLSMQEATSGDSEEETEDKEYTDAERWAYMEKSQSEEADSYKDFKKEKYEEGEFKGYHYTRKLGNIDELTENVTLKNISYEELAEKNKFFTKSGNVYSLHIEMNENADDVSEAEAYSEQGLDMMMNFYITLPQKAKTHNATSVSKDGLTYTWDLLKAPSIDISFEGVGSSWLLKVLFVIAIAAIVCFFVMKNKKQTGVTTDNLEPVEPNSETYSTPETTESTEPMPTDENSEIAENNDQQEGPIE